MIGMSALAQNLSPHSCKKQAGGGIRHGSHYSPPSYSHNPIPLPLQGEKRWKLQQPNQCPGQLKSKANSFFLFGSCLVLNSRFSLSQISQARSVYLSFSTCLFQWRHVYWTPCSLCYIFRSLDYSLRTFCLPARITSPLAPTIGHTDKTVSDWFLNVHQNFQYNFFPKKFGIVHPCFIWFCMLLAWEESFFWTRGLKFDKQLQEWRL